MTHRSPLIVFLLGFITFGLYYVYWMWTTTTEMNARGANVPHPLLASVPIVNVWWLWRWSGGVEHVTDGDWGQVASFALSLFLPGIGMAILQSAFNQLGEGRLAHAAG